MRYSSLHFIGIGGTAMGAVALACHQKGLVVTGSDISVYPPMSDFLLKNGIKYFEGYSEETIASVQPECIVVGNAISRGNPELEYALNNHIQLISMPELVKSILIDRNTSIVITGTHGKTTTSSLTAWLLESASRHPGFLVGAIPGNFVQGCRPVIEDFHNTRSGYFVSEGDEYDTSFFDKRSKFLHYRPDIMVINNCEFDHADIFDSLDAIKNSFRLCGRLVPGNGVIFVNGDDKNALDTTATAFSRIENFGLGKNNNIKAENIEYSTEGTQFDVTVRGEKFATFRTQLSGEYNVRNTLAAICVAVEIGLNAQEIQHGLDTFLLPKRRLEKIAEWNGIPIIDDFAHHPTAISETLAAIKQKYHDRRVIAVFEPRSNTTTRNIFQKELTECFEKADIVMIGAVNRPDRYAPEQRLNTQKLSEDLCNKGKSVYILSEEYFSNNDWGNHIYEYINSIKQKNDIIVLLSNGNIGGLREKFL